MSSLNLNQIKNVLIGNGYSFQLLDDQEYPLEIIINNEKASCSFILEGNAKIEFKNSDDLLKNISAGIAHAIKKQEASTLLSELFI